MDDQYFNKPVTFFTSLVEGDFKMLSGKVV